MRLITHGLPLGNSEVRESSLKVVQMYNLLSPETAETPLQSAYYQNATDECEKTEKGPDRKYMLEAARLMSTI